MSLATDVVKEILQNTVRPIWISFDVPSYIKTVVHPLTINNVDRKAIGYNTTYNICFVDKFLNQFTSSSLAESTYLGCYTLTTGYDDV